MNEQSEQKKAIQSASCGAMFNDWRPIDTAPRNGSKVLIVNEEGEMDVASYVAQWYESEEFVRKASDGDVYRTIREESGYWLTETVYLPTHWMPLPAPPGGEK